MLSGPAEDSLYVDLDGNALGFSRAGR